MDEKVLYKPALILGTIIVWVIGGNLVILTWWAIKLLFRKIKEL